MRQHSKANSEEILIMSIMMDSTKNAIYALTFLHATTLYAQAQCTRTVLYTYKLPYLCTMHMRVEQWRGDVLSQKQRFLQNPPKLSLLKSPLNQLSNAVSFKLRTFLVQKYCKINILCLFLIARIRPVYKRDKFVRRKD